MAKAVIKEKKPRSRLRHSIKKQTKLGGGMNKMRVRKSSSSSSGGSGRVVSHIHVGDSGAANLETYLKGDRKFKLQVFSEQDLPDMDMGDIVAGLDHVGTSADFCDDIHRCSRACSVGCQGHLRPNEVIIYEGIDKAGRLVERKKYKARFIIKEPPRKKECRKTTLSIAKYGEDRGGVSEEPDQDEEIEVGEEYPKKYLDIINGTPAENEVVKQYGWDPEAKSSNLTLKTSEQLTIRRLPVTQSTDAIRGKKGCNRGVYIYEICWPVRMRGTHAAVGVTTREAPLHSVGYETLIGGNLNSWGWDIGRKEAVHNRTFSRYPPSVRSHYQWTVPENFYMIIDMDDGTLSFGTSDKWLGVAFSDIKNVIVYPAVSTVWGHAEVSIRYIGSSRPESV